jgi:TldD protein
LLEKLEFAVKYGEKLGAFVDARYDDLSLRTLQRINDVWKDVIIRSRAGIGITCYYEGVSGYSFTTSHEKNDIEETVSRAFKIAKSSAPAATLRLDFGGKPAVKSQSSDTFAVRIHPKERELDHKIEMVNRMVSTAQEHGKNINNLVGLYGELYGPKYFANSDGSMLDWELEVVDLRCRVTSKTDTGALVSGYAGYGGTAGLELFESEGKTPENIGEEAGSRAKEQLEAKVCPGGKFRALIENRLVGVLAHESFGHLSEADFVVTGGSPLTGKIGEKLGTDEVTIIDENTPDVAKYGGLWLPYDDQGIAGTKTVVLENGFLKHYLHSRGTAQYLKQNPTGNCRALHFGFNAIPRMTNTYFTAGDLTEEEALEQLGTGIYAIQTAGGQVQGSGQFLFKAVRGYYVENGEKKYPLREVSLTGNILEFLKNVEGRTKDFILASGYFGGCGKGGQFPLPVGLGGPKLLMREVTFGGKAS